MDDEQLGETGHECAEQQERPELAEVEAATGGEGHRRHEGERDENGHRRARIAVRDARAAHRIVMLSAPRNSPARHAKRTPTVLDGIGPTPCTLLE